MARETIEATRRRCHRVTEGLQAAYPDAHCELDFGSPLQLLIATILSAQCSDRQVNLVTPALFAKYPRAANYASAPLPELEEAIRRIGLFRSKAKNIQAACRTLMEKFRGEVPRTMEELLELGGVGRKTANVVLGNAFDTNVGVVVDTHVARLSRRLGFSNAATPEKIEAALQTLVPQEQWTLFSHLLIWHGRRRCVARKPDCPHCEVRADCPTGQRLLDPKLSPQRREKLWKQI